MVCVLLAVTGPTDRGASCRRWLAKSTMAKNSCVTALSLGLLVGRDKGTFKALLNQRSRAVGKLGVVSDLQSFMQLRSFIDACKCNAAWLDRPIVVGRVCDYRVMHPNVSMLFSGLHSLAPLLTPEPLADLSTQVILSLGMHGEQKDVNMLKPPIECQKCIL